MAAPGVRRTVVLDANILINLIHAGRLPLLAGLTDYAFVVPEEVVIKEVTDRAQREQLDQAIARGDLRVETITEPADLTRYADLRRTVGCGEAGCLALAERHGWLLASDEKGRFLREATARLGAGRMLNTPGVFLLAIRAGLLSLDEADEAKTILERHRYRMTFRSFRDLVS